MPDDKPSNNGSGSASAAKKKRNRKKKNKNKARDDPSAQQTQQQQAQQNATQQGSSLNPHNVMRQRLIAQGFDGAKIDQAMEDMWNRDLPYDEYDAVLAFLKDGGKDKADADAKQASNGTSEPASDAKEEPEAAPTDEAPVEQAEAPPPVPVSTAPPTSLAARLEMVAGFENLADAAFALTEWVDKAAKTHELDEFCAGTKTKALPTVFSRAVADDHDNAMFESTILPAMSRLVFGILQKAGLAPDGLVSIKNSVEACLKLARKIVTTTTPSDDFGMRFGSFLASRLAVTVDEAKLALAGGGGNIQRLQEDIVKLVKKLENESANGNGASQPVSVLSNHRDTSQAAAKKASVVARMVFSTLPSAAAAENGFSAAPSNHLREVELTKPDIFVALVGADGKQKIDQQRIEYNTMKSKVETNDDDATKKIREDLEGYQGEREIIASRIAELKLSIEKLEIYDAELTAKIIDLQASLERSTLDRDAAMKSLAADMEEKQKATRFGNSLSSLVDLLKGYDDTLDQAVQAATSPAKPVLDIGSESLGSIVSDKMSMFVHQVRNYLVAECDYVTGLKARIEKTRATIAETKIEIAEMEGLGMTTTISQMERSIAKMEQQIIDDTEAIERSTSDATSMFDTLIARMEAYNIARAAEELSSIDPACFQGIPACIEALEIPNCERLNSIVEDGVLSLSPLKKQKPLPPAATSMYGTSAVAEIPPTPVAHMTEQATSAPKLTWAAAKPAAGSGTKTSLLDIQKEELQSKAES